MVLTHNVLRIIQRHSVLLLMFRDLAATPTLLDLLLLNTMYTCISDTMNMYAICKITSLVHAQNAFYFRLFHT